MPRKKQITFWACDFETTVWGEKVEQEKGKNKTVQKYGVRLMWLYMTIPKL